MTDKVSKYINGVGWRYETEHSMTRRMADHDYQSRCIYMLTLTLADRTVERLGRLEWKKSVAAELQRTEPTTAAELQRTEPTTAAELQRTEPAEPLRTEPSNARLLPTELGKAVEGEWHRLEEEHPQLKVIRVQLMPEHLHVVLFVRERIELPLGKYVAIVKSRCNKHFWRELTAQGLLGPKGTQKPPTLFSEGFTDSILMHEGQLENMIRYVEQNPYRALVKRDNRELFRQVRQMVVYEAHEPSSYGRDRAKEPNSSEHNQSGSKVLGTFAAIGNRWLLNCPMRMQVRCHNNGQPENLRLIERQKEYFLERGRKGGVVVSPCISPGEKEIARAALDAGVPLVVILENGFPPMYKPPGKYFEACAKGLLLMLAPWPYHMEKRKITRQQCLALNDMAYRLSTEAWTKELEGRLRD